MRLLFLAALVALGSVRALAMTAAADHPGSLALLLGTDRVREELKVDSLQGAVLDSLRKEYKSVVRNLLSEPQATEAEAKAAQQKLVQLNERYNRRALSVLNERQRVRLVQIEHQALGATMLYSPSVQRKIQISPRQRQEIEEIRKEGLAYVSKVNRRFDQGKISFQERIALLRKRRLSQRADLLEILTPGQRSALIALGSPRVAG